MHEILLKQEGDKAIVIKINPVAAVFAAKGGFRNEHVEKMD
jgi:hypothetical protein